EGVDLDVPVCAGERAHRKPVAAGAVVADVRAEGTRAVREEAVTAELFDARPAELSEREAIVVARQPVPDPPVLGHREGVAYVVVAVRDREELHPTQRARDRQPDLRSLIDRGSGGGNLVEHLPRRPLGETPHEPVAEVLGGELLLRRGEIGTADVRDNGVRVPARNDERDLRGPAQAGAYAWPQPDHRSFAHRPGRCVRVPAREALADERCFRRLGWAA